MLVVVAGENYPREAFFVLEQLHEPTCIRPRGIAGVTPPSIRTRLHAVPPDPWPIELDRFLQSKYGNGA